MTGCGQKLRGKRNFKYVEQEKRETPIRLFGRFREFGRALLKG